jgi:hypothetical protein
MQLAHARQPIGDPPGNQNGSVLIQQAQVMVTFAPVHPKKQHGALPCSDLLVCEPEKDPRRPIGSAHLARHPTSRPPSSTLAGHSLPENSRGSEASECSPAGSSAIASHRRLVQPH